MDNDNSQKIINQKSIDEVNLVKERLCNDSWEKIKDDKLFLKKVSSQSEDFDPIGMILSERSLVLQRAFTNGSTVPIEKSSKILEKFISFDFSQDISLLQNELNQICPGLIINTKIDLKRLQKDFQNLPNGLRNIKTIGFQELAKTIYVDVTTMKNLPKERVDLLVINIDSLMAELNQRYSKNLEPTPEQLKKIVDTLQSFGRSKFQIDAMKEKGNALTIMELLDRSKLAIGAVQEAYIENQISNLSDLNIIASLLEKVQEKESK